MMYTDVILAFTQNYRQAEPHKFHCADVGGDASVTSPEVLCIYVVYITPKDVQHVQRCE